MEQLSVSQYTCALHVHIYIYMYVYVYIFIHIYSFISSYPKASTSILVQQAPSQVLCFQLPPGCVISFCSQLGWRVRRTLILLWPGRKRPTAVGSAARKFCGWRHVVNSWGPERTNTMIKCSYKVGTPLSQDHAVITSSWWSLCLHFQRAISQQTRCAYCQECLSYRQERLC